MPGDVQGGRARAGDARVGCARGCRLGCACGIGMVQRKRKKHALHPSTRKKHASTSRTCPLLRGHCLACPVKAEREGVLISLRLCQLPRVSAPLTTHGEVAMERDWLHCRDERQRKSVKPSPCTHTTSSTPVRVRGLLRAIALLPLSAVLSAVLLRAVLSLWPRSCLAAPASLLSSTHACTLCLLLPTCHCVHAHTRKQDMHRS